MKLPQGYKITVFKNSPSILEFVRNNDPDVDFLSLSIKASTKVSYVYYWNGEVIGVSLAQVIKNEGVEYYECVDESLHPSIVDALRFRVYQKRFRTNVYTHSPVSD